MIIRRAAEADRAPLAAMLCRCSEQSRYQRFHSPVRRFPEPYLTEALKGSAHHRALVAQTPAGVIVALASCVAETDRTAEIGILVEDAWQRQGIGARLLDMLMAHAAASGIPRMRAVLLPEHRQLSRLLLSRNIEPVIT